MGPMPKLTVGDYQVEARDGSEILKIHNNNPHLALKFGCRRGNCGACAIKVISGSQNLTKMCAQEADVLKRKGLGDDYRLACQCALNGDVTLCP